MLRAAPPVVLLVLLPKCPACVAAYLALGLGLKLSLLAAVWLQTLLIVLCVAVFAYLLYRQWMAAAKERAGKASAASPGSSTLSSDRCCGL